MSTRFARIIRQMTEKDISAMNSGLSVFIKSLKSLGKKKEYVPFNPKIRITIFNNQIFNKSSQLQRRLSYGKQSMYNSLQRRFSTIK